MKNRKKLPGEKFPMTRSIAVMRAELLQRAKKRDEHLEGIELDTDRSGDTENRHFALAVKSENARFIAKLKEES
jgi:hypothetical protein